MNFTMMASHYDRLVLGTVQLGMLYGIANSSGQPDFAMAREIIIAAWESGINKFDTAQGYGVSESVLSRALNELGIAEKVQVFSKIHPETDHADYQAIRQAIEQSSSMFGPSLHCIMLHREELLRQWHYGLGEMLRDCRDEGLFPSIGISVYEPDSARRALETEGIDLVQVPANILDRRHEQAGVMRLAKKLGKTIMIRSVFLQGALLLPVTDLPARIRPALPYLESIASLADQLAITPHELAMAFVRDQWPEALIVFGAELPGQVIENAESWAKILPDEVLKQVKNLGEDVPLEVVRPDLWEDPSPLAIGKRLRLRHMRPSDAYGEYVRWMNDPEVTRYLESRYTTYTSKDLERYILDQRNNPSILFLAIEEIHTGRHIGNIKIGPRHAVHGTAEIGFIIGEKGCWSKGYATEAIGLGLDLAFDKLEVRKVIAGCYKANVASEKAFRKNGFSQEGFFGQQVSSGETIDDVVYFGILRESWQQSTARQELDENISIRERH